LKTWQVRWADGALERLNKALDNLDTTYTTRVVLVDVGVKEKVWEFFHSQDLANEEPAQSQKRAQTSTRPSPDDDEAEASDDEGLSHDRVVITHVVLAQVASRHSSGACSGNTSLFANVSVRVLTLLYCFTCQKQGMVSSPRSRKS
jgi:hypothetical protein